MFTLWLALALAAPAATVEVDLCVYGGTSGGVSAAVTAARLGKSVILIEPTSHLGGLSSGGLGATDIGNKAVIGGLSREFYRRVGRHYNKDESWTFEPGVAEKVFNDLIREQNVRVVMDHRIHKLRKDGTRITEVSFDHAPPEADGSPAPTAQTADALTVRAKVFIDATYEGDLMARAGVRYHVGRESAAQYGESLNGVRPVLEPKPWPRDISRGGHFFTVKVDPYRTPGDPSSGLLPYIQDGDGGKVGDGDEAVQAYNFRLCLTRRNDIRLPWTAPDGFDPANYELLARYIDALIADGRTPNIQYLLNPVAMPNGKTDCNNNNAVSSDFIGQNYDYPDGDWPTRHRVWRDHLRYIQGMMYFLATSPRVPEVVRKDINLWGPSRDEFVGTANWPHQMYVREARRMVGEYVITQADCEHRRIADDSIGMGAYNMDSHNCQRIVRNGYVQNEGDVQVPPRAPYRISYRAVTPKSAECTNLLVPVCFSSSHIAYGSARMEPVFMVVGESAARAAVRAIDANCAVQAIDVKSLQDELRQAGQVLEYTPPAKKPAAK